MHCINFFNALINTLLTHPGPSNGRVGQCLSTFLLQQNPV